MTELTQTYETKQTTQNLKWIPIKIKTSIPDPVLNAHRNLVSHGNKAWLAGGCVRDLIMNRTPRDWDIVTNVSVENIRKIFPNHLEVGVAFGIIKLIPIMIKDLPIHIDIAMFRSEGTYSDKRHPDHVAPGDEKTDVARRDFTINALYFDPIESKIIDHVGGCKDIAAKLIRTVGDPMTRFSEDALRILRAARFSAQLGFKIDRPTVVAMKKCRQLLCHISRERIRDEVFRTLQSQRAISGLETIAQTGLWEIVFGVKRLNLPADFRQLKLNWTPQPLDWICALGVTGLLGNPIKEPTHTMVKRLSDLLKLSNVERHVLSRVLSIFDDSSSEHPGCSPLAWIHLMQANRPLVDILKAFIRRARGPTEEQKEKAIRLLNQTLRWLSNPDFEKTLPMAEALMKEGFKEGAKLGKELRDRQWKAFWGMK